MKDKLILLGILMAFALGGCIEMQEVSTEEKYPAVVIGKPISVVPNVGDSFDYIAVVVEVDGKYVLAITDFEDDRELTAAMAIIQSEISDEDEDGTVELKGHYSKDENEKGRFIMQYLKANGLELEF